MNFNLTGAGEEDEEERKEPGEEDEGEVIQSQRSENRAAAFSPLEVKINHVLNVIFLSAFLCDSLTFLKSETVSLKSFRDDSKFQRFEHESVS